MTSTPVTTTPSTATAAFPPQLMMWAGMYAVLFTIAGGMIAYMYKPD